MSIKLILLYILFRYIFGIETVSAAAGVHVFGSNNIAKDCILPVQSNVHIYIKYNN